MARTINSATLTALQADSVRLAHLVRIGFDTELFVTDYAHNLTYDSDEYLAAGHFLSLSDTQESNDLRVGSMSLTLSAVDQAYVSIFLNQNYVNRRIRIWLAILNDNAAIIGDPIKTFDGEVTGYSLQNSSSTAVINMTAASHWADFERKNGRFTNNNSQQYYFPNDTGMEFAAESIKDIKWGKA